MITVAFTGQPNIEVTDILRERVKSVLISVIENDRANKFLLGDRSVFNDLCCEILSELKQKYPHIKRVYVKAKKENTNDDNETYLLERCDETCFPKKLEGLGQYAYAARDRLTVEKCKILIAYCDKDYTASAWSRGFTKIAVAYAQRKHKKVINVFEPKGE